MPSKTLRRDKLRIDQNVEVQSLAFAYPHRIRQLDWGFPFICMLGEIKQMAQILLRNIVEVLKPVNSKELQAGTGDMYCKWE